MLNNEKEQFIAQILSDLDYHCTEEQRKEILKRVLASFCPCCGFKIKSEDTNKGEIGALQCFCNHLEHDSELTIVSDYGDHVVKEKQFVIELVGEDADVIYSGAKVRLVPIK